MKLILLALLCPVSMNDADCNADTATVVISKPATQMECAFPMQAMFPVMVRSYLTDAPVPLPGEGESWRVSCVKSM